MALFERPVKISQIVTTSLDEAVALSDPIRITILEMLFEKPMSIIDLVEELRKRGVDKAPTTVRHHLELLKKAGLIELTKAEDVKGGILKYYASKARFLGHQAPKDFDERFEDVVQKLSRTICDIVREIADRHGQRINEAAEEIKPCPYCKTQDFEEYVILTLLNRAIVEAIRSEDFKEALERLEQGWTKV